MQGITPVSLPLSQARFCYWAQSDTNHTRRTLKSQQMVTPAQIAVSGSSVRVVCAAARIDSGTSP
jgi:hypothetical protein